MNINETYLEKMLMKSLIKDRSFLPSIAEKFDPQIFTDKSYEEVARFYKKFYKEKNRIPTTQDIRLLANEGNMAEHIKNVWTTLKNVNLEEMPKDELYSYYENYMKKRLALITFKNIFSNYDPNGELDADMLVDKFTNVASLKLIQDDAFDIYKNVDKFVAEIKKNDERIALGFTEIDKLIGGGLPRNGKTLSVVSAPTNMGKSIFLANVAVNACKQGKNVLVISLEMSEIVYAQRIYSDMYNLPINKIPSLTIELENLVKEK